MSAHRATTDRSRTVLLLVASTVGVVAFLYPILLPVLVDGDSGDQRARTAEAPLVLSVVVACVIGAVVSMAAPLRSGDRNASRTAALLSSLVALDALLRLVPSIGGASLVFAPIVLSGAVFGAEFGFLMGVLSLGLSAVLTGGIGPWLPFQALAAGWIGGTAGWLPVGLPIRVRLAMLAVFAFLWGFGYGALLNLYNWPYLSPGGIEVGLYWNPAGGLRDNLQRYGQYYLVTSLAHDAMRAIANAALVLAIGAPMLLALERARVRSRWTELPVNGTDIAVSSQRQHE